MAAPEARRSSHSVALCGLWAEAERAKTSPRTDRNFGNSETNQRQRRDPFQRHRCRAPTRGCCTSCCDAGNLLDRDGVESQPFKLGCDVRVASVGALPHSVVERDKSSEVLGVGQPSRASGSPVLVGDGSRDASQHDVLVVSPLRSGATSEEDDILVWGERGRKRERKRLLLVSHFGSDFLLGHASTRLTPIAYAVKTKTCTCGCQNSGNTSRSGKRSVPGGRAQTSSGMGSSRALAASTSAR
jgi:hypothetical protein